MKKILIIIKSSKIVNSGFVKKLKDKIYFKIINPKLEKKTDKYRVEIIEKFGKICKNCHWQLLAGAFLKYYRDDSMDGQDLDFFILEKDFDKVKNEFLKNGFSIKQVFMDHKNKIKEYKLLYKDVEVDIFMMTKEKNHYYSSFTLEKDGAKDIKREVSDNIQKIYGKNYCSYTRKIDNFAHSKDYQYKNINFKGPKNPEAMLVECYGEGWKVYDPNFNPRTSPDNNPPIEHDSAKSIVFINPISSFEDIDVNI